VRWLFSFLALFLLWLAFLLSPYAALYDFARALEAKDVRAINARVDFPRLRISLAGQLSSAYLNAKKGTQEQGAFGQMAAGAGAAMLDPLIGPYATPEALAEMFTTGFPGVQRPAGASSRPEAGLIPANLNDLSAERLRQIFLAVEGRGFSGFAVGLPLDAAPAERIRAVFRLSGWSNGFMWRLVGLELPAAIRGRIIAEIARREGQGR
jgi:hypothetical protein